MERDNETKTETKTDAEPSLWETACAKVKGFRAAGKAVVEAAKGIRRTVDALVEPLRKLLAVYAAEQFADADKPTLQEANTFVRTVSPSIADASGLRETTVRQYFTDVWREKLGLPKQTAHNTGGNGGGSATIRKRDNAAAAAVDGTMYAVPFDGTRGMAEELRKLLLAASAKFPVVADVCILVASATAHTGSAIPAALVRAACERVKACPVDVPVNDKAADKAAAVEANKAEAAKRAEAEAAKRAAELPGSTVPPEPEDKAAELAKLRARAASAARKEAEAEAKRKARAERIARAIVAKTDKARVA